MLQEYANRQIPTNPFDLMNLIKKFNFENQDKKDYVIRRLKFRQWLKMDTIVILTGAKRSGKSYSAIKIAEKMNEDFDVETDLFFETKPFLIEFKKANNGVFVLDEVSVNYNAREWYDIQHKIFNTLLTTQGFRSNCVLMTLPDLNDLDKVARHKAHFIFNTINRGFVKCYYIKNLHHMGKAWLEPFSFLTLELPTEKNIEKYEQIKKEWNDNRLESDIQLMDAYENPETYSRKLPYNDLLKLFKSGVIDYLKFSEKMKQLNFADEDIELMKNQIEFEKEKIRDREQQKEERQKFEEKFDPEKTFVSPFW